MVGDHEINHFVDRVEGSEPIHVDSEVVCLIPHR